MSLINLDAQLAPVLDVNSLRAIRIISLTRSLATHFPDDTYEIAEIRSTAMGKMDDELVNEWSLYKESREESRINALKDQQQHCMLGVYWVVREMCDSQTQDITPQSIETIPPEYANSKQAFIKAVESRLSERFSGAYADIMFDLLSTQDSEPPVIDDPEAFIHNFQAYTGRAINLLSASNWVAYATMKYREGG